MNKGIDVSRWQETIDWKKVKDSGINFAFIKSSQGGSVSESRFNPFKDSYFDRNIVNASAAGILCGIYHYMTSTIEDDVLKEAQYLISILNPYRDKIKYPVAIDIEESRYTVLNKSHNSGLVRIFADAIKAAGYKVILYSCKDFLVNHLDMNALSDLDVWLALYYTPRSTATSPVFNNMTIWQWTSSGVSIPGIAGSVDCNISYKNYAEKIPGDLNSDGKIDAVDALFLKQYLLGNRALTEEQKALADMNNDGKVDSIDYLLMRRKIIGN
jgi:GH25 family lysozyme M1 (1,4-beta-N-acetylmuramidase)